MGTSLPSLRAMLRRARAINDRLAIANLEAEIRRLERDEVMPPKPAPRSLYERLHSR